MELSKIIDQLKAEGVKCSIVGGYAVALHGAIRGTIDLDIIIEHSEEQFVSCERALKSLGYQARLPVTASEVYKFRQEYIEQRNLIAWSFVHPRNPLDVVDVIITHNLKNFHSVSKRFGLQQIPVLSINDLIQMKTESGRPQDLEDVKMLETIKRARS